MERFAAEMRVEPLANLRGLGVLGIELEQAHEHPVAVHAAMPIEAAEKRRMQLARAKLRGWSRHHMLGLIRIFLVEAVQGQLGKGCKLPIRQLAAEGG